MCGYSNSVWTNIESVEQSQKQATEYKNKTTYSMGSGGKDEGKTDNAHIIYY